MLLFMLINPFAHLKLQRFNTNLQVNPFLRTHTFDHRPSQLSFNDF